jgi:hypothetical protein
LAFHPYPQLISHFCNSEEFGPPRSITFASIPATSRPIKTRFRCGSGYYPLNLATEIDSLGHSPKGTRSGISQRDNALPLFVSIRFQVLFHSGHPGSFHLSLTVLVHYRSSRVFSLGKWASLLPAGLACPAVLKVSDGSLLSFAYGAITLCDRPFQSLSARD